MRNDKKRRRTVRKAIQKRIIRKKGKRARHDNIRSKRTRRVTRIRSNKEPIQGLIHNEAFNIFHSKPDFFEVLQEIIERRDSKAPTQKYPRIQDHLKATQMSNDETISRLTNDVMHNSNILGQSIGQLRSARAFRAEITQWLEENK